MDSAHLRSKATEKQSLSDFPKHTWQANGGPWLQIQAVWSWSLLLWPLYSPTLCLSFYLESQGERPRPHPCGMSWNRFLLCLPWQAGCARRRLSWWDAHSAGSTAKPQGGGLTLGSGSGGVQLKPDVGLPVDWFTGIALVPSHFLTSGILYLSRFLFHWRKSEWTSVV